jgi:hypothetical protein
MVSISKIVELFDKFESQRASLVICSANTIRSAKPETVRTRRSSAACLSHTTHSLVAAFFFATFAVAQSPVPDTPQGFQQQYHPSFEAYQRHDNPGFEKHLNTFAIPQPWFNQTFGRERGPGLAAQYASEFSDFKQRTATNFAGIDSVKARIHVDPGTPTDIRARRWTPAESTSTLQGIPALRAPLPPVQKFEVDYVLAAPGQSARLTSWIDSFVYIDGGFRYFGHANKPFWARGTSAQKP